MQIGPLSHLIRVKYILNYMANLRQVRIIHEHFAKMKELMQIKGSFVQTEAKMNKISRTIYDQKNKK